MNGGGRSDGSIVPEKPANKGVGAPSPAERVEGRGPAKGNPDQQTRDRSLKRGTLQQALERIRQKAREEREFRFTSLWHHVYDVDRLREAYFSLRRNSAPGIDGQTWRAYGEDLEGNLTNLSERLKRGAYRAKPVRRTYIPKGEGQLRPIGVPVLEDKIVQRATVEVLNAIYEVDFLGFSYGYRPGRSQHDALDALVVGIERQNVNWVFEADLRGFFDSICHEWLVKFLEHRIADKRVIRHVKKWLKAGVLEDGQWRRVDEGSPQGGSVSPLLANVFLHYAFDLWGHQWRKRQGKGRMIIIRYCDDFVVGFEDHWDAERFRHDLEERLRRFKLELHPEKTRLLEFGQRAAERRDRRGGTKLGTFEFLGFTHYCGKRKDGRYVVMRRSSSKRMRRKLADIKKQLRRRMHLPIPEQGKWLRSVLVGWFRYHGVPFNADAMNCFRHQVTLRWLRSLRRRSQRAGRRLTWARMHRLICTWLPYPKCYHPFPIQRLRVSTQGRSPVR